MAAIVSWVTRVWFLLKHKSLIGSLNVSSKFNFKSKHMISEWDIHRSHCVMHTHTTVLRLFGFCLGQPGWAGTRRNIHPLTLIVVINHPYLLSPSTTIALCWVTVIIKWSANGGMLVLRCQLDESCVQQHINERRVRTLEEEDEAATSVTEVDTTSADNNDLEYDLE